MKTLKWLLLGLGVLGVNNLVLLNMMGYSASDKTSDLDQHLAAESGGTEKRIGSAQNRPVAVPSSVGSSSSSDIQLAIQDYMHGDAYEAFLLSRFQAFTENEAQKVERLSGASWTDAIDFFHEATTREEKTLALDELRSKLKEDLDPSELKNIYLELDGLDDPDADEAKIEFLVRLVENGDAEALEWSKDKLRGGNILTQSNRIAGQFYEDLYNQDPDFFREWANDLDPKDIATSFSLRRTIGSDPETAASYFDNNIATALRSGDTDQHEFLGRIARFNRDSDFELSNQQAARVPSLLQAQSKKTREFAISLTGHIDDPKILADSFNVLTGVVDQRQFLLTLATRGGEEFRNLASELAATTSEPSLQRFVRPVRR